jgi:outer membrane protein assembly factor BamA
MALATKSYNFVYEGDFIKAVGNSDLLIRANIKAPTNVTNFFGLGNETVYDKSKGIQYYRARYDRADFGALLRRQLQSWMRVSYGATFQFFRLEEDQNQGKLVSDPDAAGVDSAYYFERKAFAGPYVGLQINSKNNQVLPTRGFVLDAGVRPLFAVDGKSNNVTQVHTDMRLFASFKSRAIMVYAIRLGVAHNFGKYEFQQAQYLGGTTNLRGYRRDRFAGKTMFYNNMEIRLKIADFKTYLFPGAFGLFVFNDVGRVWVQNDDSNDWHVGNGIGLWLAPVKRFVVTGAFTRSKEEKALPLVTVGFQF